MNLHVRSGGVWRTVVGAFVKQGGVWRTATAVFSKQAGTWRQAFTGFLLNTSTANISNVTFSPATITASITFQTDGNLTGSSLSGASDWGTPNTVGIGTGYHVRCVDIGAVFGGNISGFTFNTWYQLNVSKTFSFSNSPNTDNEIDQVKFDLSSDSGSTTAASFNCNISVGYEP